MYRGFINGAIKILKTEPDTTEEVKIDCAHLVHGQVDASVGDNAEHVGDVAFVKRCQSFSPENLLRTV